MKKIKTIFAAVLAAAAIPSCAYAMEVNIASSVIDNNQWITINGISDKEFSDISIKVMKPGAENSENIEDAIMITSVGADADKNFEKSFRIPSEIEEGTYTFSFKDVDGNELVKEYKISSLTLTLEKFDIICKSESVTDIQAAIKSHAEIIGINALKYNQLTDTQKKEAIELFIINRDALSKTEFTADEISNLLEEASIIAEIKTSGDKAESVISSYEELLGIKQTDIYKKYEKNIDNANFTALCARIVKCKDRYTSYETLRSEAEQQILFQVIQGGGSWYTTKDVIENNYEELGLTATDIAKVSKLKKSSSLYQELTATESYTKDEFVVLFNKVYSQVLSDETYSGGGSSGGSGGGSSGGGGSYSGSGGGNYMPPVNTVTNNEPDNEEDEANTGFDDVAVQTPWAEKAINELSKRGVVNGKDNGIFAPGDTVKREEFAKMLVLAAGYTLESGKDTGFTDVDDNMWYAQYVETAKTNGIINGISDTEYGIGDEISRQDMAVMIYRAFGQKFSNEDEITFADKDEISEYAREAVAYMAYNGIISGQDNNVFAPKSSATRAEAAVMLYNAINFIGK